jgi:hypothetical protein
LSREVIRVEGVPWGELVKWFGPGVAVLMAVLFLGYKQVWVWGRQLKDMTDERNFWRAQCLALLKVTEKTVETTLPVLGG